MAPNWGARFRLLADLLATEATTRAKKPVVQAVAIRKQLEQHHDALERMGVKAPAAAQTWPDLTIWARHALLGEPETSTDEHATARWRGHVLSSSAGR